MGMIIREMRADDHDDIHETLTACGVFNEEEIRVALVMAAAADEYALFCAEIDRRVRGYVCIGRTPLTLSTWYLYWTCVHPQVQGTGVASALHGHLEQFIRAHGGERIVVETSSRAEYARAHRFYANAGYQPAGRIEHFFKQGDHCVILCKPLTQHLPSSST
jgi:ribosomal protein S18 acetylase RimI-like enzyme